MADAAGRVGSLVARFEARPSQEPGACKSALAAEHPLAAAFARWWRLSQPAVKSKEAAAPESEPLRPSVLLRVASPCRSLAKEAPTADAPSARAVDRFAPQATPPAATV